MKYLSLILLIAFSSFSSELIACKCKALSPQEDYKISHHEMEVCILKLIKEKRNGERIHLAEVKHHYKGSTTSNTIQIKQGTSTCDYFFLVRNTYLFYGREDENGFYVTNNCHRTRNIKHAIKDLRFLNEITNH
jgi:hypothetical protein